MPTPAPIQLLPATNISADGVGNPVYGLNRTQGLLVGLNLSAKPTGGLSTLDVYLQTTPDGGTTWQDIAHIQFTTTLGWRYWQLTQITAGKASNYAPSDGALTGDTVVQGPFGDQMRLKYKCALNGDTGNFTLAVNAVSVGAPVIAACGWRLGTQASGRKRKSLGNLVPPKCLFLLPQTTSNPLFLRRSLVPPFCISRLTTDRRFKATTAASCQTSSEHLLDQLRGRAHTTAADLTQKYEDEYREYLEAQRDIRPKHAPAEAEEALRIGEEAGRAEGGEGILGEDGPDAERGRSEEAAK